MHRRAILMTITVTLATLGLTAASARAEDGPVSAAPVAEQHLIQVTNLMDMIIAGGLCFDQGRACFQHV